MATSRAARRHLPSSPFNRPVDAEPVEQFDIEDRVTHDTHGLGRVVGVENDAAVVVQFGATQVRVLTPYRKLHKL